MANFGIPISSYKVFSRKLEVFSRKLKEISVMKMTFFVSSTFTFRFLRGRAAQIPLKAPGPGGVIFSLEGSPQAHEEIFSCLDYNFLGYQAQSGRARGAARSSAECRPWRVTAARPVRFGGVKKLAHSPTHLAQPGRKGRFCRAIPVE